MDLPSLRKIPKRILLVAFYGFLLSISTQMLYSHLALFLKFDLNVTESQIGWIDGFVEFLSYMIRIFSGMISDCICNRKLFLMIGCAVACLVKPVFSFANSVAGVLAAEILERIGNGIQASPRDALLADLSDKDRLGESFGFAKSMKTMGALVGAPIALAIMYFSNGNYAVLFAAASIPALIAFFFLAKINMQGSKAIRIPNLIKKFENPFKKKYLKSLNLQFVTLMIFAFFCELGHFGEALMTIGASRIVSPSFAGITSAFMGIGQIIFSYPIGWLSDRHGKLFLIRICLFLAGISYALIATSNNGFVYFFSVAVLCGQHASIQAIFLSMISERINPRLRGTAIGIFYCTIGLSYMLSSEICGLICENFGYETAFLYSSMVCVLCLFAGFSKRFFGKLQTTGVVSVILELN
ncbi:MFS transporter [Alphaproteobacteria bacterium]|nr:MFS transporter [Alphaproteobacteria bacterium]